MAQQHKRRTIEWRLNVVMSERRIKTVSELKRRLDDAGICISSAQLGRVVWERPKKINIELLEGLLTVLECDVSDILKVAVIPESGDVDEPESTERANKHTKSKPQTKEPRQRVKPVLTSSSEDITGPKLTAIPMPERKK